MVKLLKKKVTKEQKKRHNQKYISKTGVFRVSRKTANLAMKFITDNNLKVSNIIELVHLMVWHLSDHGMKKISPNILTLLPTQQDPFKPSEKTLPSSELKRVNVKHHIKDAIDLMAIALCGAVKAFYPNAFLRAYEAPDYILKLAINYCAQLSQEDLDTFLRLKAEDRLFSLSTKYFAV